MGFLDGLFQTKALPVQASTSTVARAFSGGNSSSSPWGTSLFGSNRKRWDLDTAITKGYDRVVWVFRCVHVIAAQQAAVPILLKDYTTVQGKAVDDKNFFRLLNKKANPYESAYQFRYRLSTQLLLSPKGAFIELVRSPAGQVVEMYLLPPDAVTPIKDPKKFVSGYQVKRGDNAANSVVDTLSPDDIIWIRTTPDPIDPYKQVTPLPACGIAVETDFLARVFNRNFLQNDGRPGMLIGISGDMSSDDAQELKSMFAGGYAQAGTTRVIEADNVAVVDFSVRPRDAQWEDAAKDAKDTILAAFGVPESVLGNAAGRCLRDTELVTLANGEVKMAKELVGQKFELVQPQSDFNGYNVVTAKASYNNNGIYEKAYRVTTFSGRTIDTNSEHPLFAATSVAKGKFKRDVFPLGWKSVKEIKTLFDVNDADANARKHTEVAVPIKFDAIVNNDEFDLDQAKFEGEQLLEIPDYLFTASKQAQQAFVSGLFNKNAKLSQHTHYGVTVPTKMYARKLQALLVRLGVAAMINTYKMTHVVTVSGKVNMVNFLSLLDLDGDNLKFAQNSWDRLKAGSLREHNSLRSDGLPEGMIWDRVLSVEEIGKCKTVALTVQGNHSYVSMFWEHNTYDNADNETEGFWTQTMKAHCDAIADALEPLTGDPEDNIYIEYDYTTIDVLQAAKRRRDDQYAQDFARGAITIDEYLTLTGREPWDVAGTRVLYFNNMVIARNPEDAAEVSKYPLITQNGQQQGAVNPFAIGTGNGGDGVIGGNTDQVQGQLANNAPESAAQTVNNQAARVLRSANHNNTADTSTSPNQNAAVYTRINNLRNKSWSGETVEVKAIDTIEDVHRDIRHQIEGYVEGTINSWSHRQLKVAKERLNHAKLRKGTRHWTGNDGGTKSLDTNYVLETKDWADELCDNLAEYLQSSLKVFADREVNKIVDLDIEINFDPAVCKDIANKTVAFVEQSVSNQTELVKNHIGILDTGLKSIEEIQNTLFDEAFDRKRWATAVAKKVASASIESLYFNLYKKVDHPVVKVWCTAHNEMDRTSHAQLHGQVKRIDQDFETKEFKTLYPTDLEGSESNNCSCWVRYELSDNG